MILLLDNYDSFTYNIYQYVSEEGFQVKVVRNNCVTVDEVKALKPQAIIISPGPGLPDQAGVCLKIVNAFYQQIPILGICLGHQIIGEALGASLRQSNQIMHGKTSLVTHNGAGIFQYLSQPLEVMRYHSYVLAEESLPPQLELVATSLEDKEVMAIQHPFYQVYGVQFHPESIGTAVGKKMIHNFIQGIRKENPYENLS
ncbi:MAG: anthranilate synthase component II [Bacillota bacterium]|uniref:anthranilate synthase component II n=1 Tax=unclassified Virgibacillus TaxID=2620237 RepID=UPI0003FD3F0B|nr:MULTISPECIES: aminodeoxychorismate/anthranilate synthase component II [Bacillaceae]MCC2250675.1 aminodeoxychorismate/anthranilate synthase component II [Virgibacillus sp. AGTR]MDY7046358.1 aminodeoxychorismate/anthranilate synthase component II [Virgibacillus sp. M23]QRZ19535.1 aminodeoxychorismate/anthranilate synthase component II [Virgibacillus sp. AGTR]